MKMIETIRLFRNKEDDIHALFILEFLKFIGCITFDFVIPSNGGDIRELKDGYDINVFLNISSERLQEEGCRELKELWDGKKEDSGKVVLLFSKNSGIRSRNEEGKSLLLSELAAAIWEEDTVRQEIEALNAAYTKYEVFQNLYCKGNLKFIQEYYPITGRGDTAAQVRMEAFQKIHHSLAVCYNELSETEARSCKQTPYYEYAVLLLKYKLNGLNMLLGERRIFHTEGLLQNYREIVRRDGGLIRQYYLAGSIGEVDKKYLWEAEDYFERAIGRLKRKAEDIEVLDFLYYRMGRYYEKVRKNLKRAEEYYEKSNACNKQYYKVLYKIAKKKERENKWEEAEEVTRRLNSLIVNEHSLQEIMPKQQIYAYKSGMLLGDILFEEKREEEAIQSYEWAMKIAKTDSSFFEAFEEEQVFCFREVLRAGMSIPVTCHRIMECAVVCGDKEKYREYSEILEEL